MYITVLGLKEKLQNVINRLDNYGDNKIIHTASNSYFVDSGYYISIPGKGFIDLNGIESIIECED